MMKKLLALILFIALAQLSFAQQSATDIFWENLKKHCGKAYTSNAGVGLGADFKDKKLVMHVRACGEHVIRIPFFVGDDKSRTWVLTRKGDRIELKHDHRKPDGSHDEITMYGGSTNNTGFNTMQIFPADQQTTKMLPRAASNVWWITLDDKQFTYNLRVMGSERVFSVYFDLSQEVEIPSAPWGWQD